MNAGTASGVVISAIITSPNLIAGSVNVQRLDSLGRPIAVLKSLNDGGVDGDEVAGDGVYSGTVVLNEPVAGKVTVRVSAALRGSIARAASSPLTIDVIPAGLPTEIVRPNVTKHDVDSITGVDIISNEVIACLSDTADPRTVLAASGVNGATVGGRLTVVGNCYQLLLGDSSTAADVRAAITALQQSPDVVFAEPDFLGETSLVPCATPALPTCSDPSYALLRLDDAHDTTVGAGVTVAVLDTGVDSLATDLAPHVTRGPNFTTVGPANDPEDDDGHGTHVSGILAATAPGARLVAIKVCAPQAAGAHPTCPTISIIRGIDEALHRRAKVINMSLGAQSKDDPLLGGLATLQELGEERAVPRAVTADVVVVAAAGNDNSSSRNYPAFFPTVIAVGAIDTRDRRYMTDATHGSNFGSWVDIAAPGVGVTSDDLFGLTGVKTGTSMAAPFVSGTAALLRALHPGWSADQVQAQLKASALAIGPNDHLSATNDNLQLGSGRLGSLAALGAVRIIHTGAVISVPMTAFLSGPGGTVANSSLQFGRQYDLTTHAQQESCETLTSFYCLYDLPFDIQHLPNGSYTFTLRLNSTIVDFGGWVQITAPGLTFASVDNPLTGSIVDQKTASCFLIGPGTSGRRAVTFTLAKANGL